MPGNESIVLALLRIRETAQSVHLTVVLKSVAATREHLVPVGLVTNVPHDAVVWRVEHIVQCHCKINSPHARRKMPGIHRQRFDEESPQLTAHVGQRINRHLAQIGRTINLPQQWETIFYILFIQFLKYLLHQTTSHTITLGSICFAYSHRPTIVLYIFYITEQI